MPVSDVASVRPAICLNMIVRNEAHIVDELLDSVAPFIASWVIVDTGSDDGTQDVIERHMTTLGIPGELYQRPWRNFGHNRSEALALAQGHGDYIWVMDADDVLVGTPDFSQLSADVYQMRYGAGFTYWYPLLFRDGSRVRYVGVTHEFPHFDKSYVVARLEGNYHIEDRQRSSRNLSGQKFENDRDLLLAEVERNPEDARSVFYLAQSYFCLADFVNASKWYARRVELGGWDQEVYYAMLRIAESMEQLGEPWPDVQDAYLRAWEFRPTRAEALYAIVRRYSAEKRYQLGYLFAERAAQIPLPEEDILFVRADVHAWRAVDQQAVCAFWIGRQAEAFRLCRSLLARSDIPEDDRQRITRNRDFSVPAMIDAALPYPQVLVGDLVAGPRDAEVTVSLVAGADRGDVEQMLNSFLNCCTDVSQVGRFLVVDAGLSAQDLAMLGERYGFVEFVDCGPGDGSGAQLGRLREQIGGRFWLHLGQGWRFFAPEGFIARLIAVLEAEPEVFQVGVNFADAGKLTGSCAAEGAVRRAPDAGRYVPVDSVVSGPAMFDTARLDQAGGVDQTDLDPIAGLGRRAATAGLRSATLDEVLCTKEPVGGLGAGGRAFLRLPGSVTYTRSLDTVPGWFYPTDFRLFDFILGGQLLDDVTGDILEIGAYQGKSAVLLGYGLRDDDTLVVCDLFGLDPGELQSPTEGMGAYTGLTLDCFYENYDRFHSRRPQVEICTSSQLEDRIAGRRFRFIHIDGGHAYECVRGDIQTVTQHAVEEAVIVLDDYRSPHTPGVAAAVWEAAVKGSLHPFCITDMKLYATTSSDGQKRWLSALVDFSKADAPWEFEVHQVLGSELLRAWKR